jgi:2-acylglycerol O-acyltransferase 2
MSSAEVVAAFVAVTSVPLTHGVAGHLLHKDATNPWRFCSPPFLTGGPRFMTFQGFSWAFFAISSLCLVLAIGQLYSKMAKAAFVSSPRQLLTASGCSALISEVLMVSSLFTYHRGRRLRHRRAPSTGTQNLTEAGTKVTVAMCCALALAGAALLLVAHHFHAADPFARLAFVSLALVCFSVAAPVTHGLGGRLKWALSGSWTFYQPGRGGLRFILCQAFGWASFAVSVAGCAVLAAIVLRAVMKGGLGEGAEEMRAVAVVSWVAGGAGFLAQVFLAVSLPLFRPSGGIGETASAPACTSKVSQTSDMRGFLQMMLVMHVIHAPHLLLLALIATVLAAAPTAAWGATVFAVLAAAYSPTFFGAPGSTGMRSWTAFQAWATRVVEDAARRWHGECQVVRHGEAWQFRGVDIGVDLEEEDGGKETGDARRVIFGYHPHGLYPAAACWFHFLPQFNLLFPSVPPPVTLGASVIFRVPILRDVAMWAGARNVSRSTFLKSLDERGAVVLCPGGQAELVEHVGGQADNTVTLCTRHKGFIKIAIEKRAHLVPVFCFGESQALTNLWKWKAAQRWTTKRLGFPMPFLAVGFKGILPLPVPLPLSFIVGEPLAVPVPGPEGFALEADVNRVHQQYYARVEELFERYKASSGFANLTLALKHD